jgi:2-oxoglutarate dehydrogenase complex dehydrogenase (E1) component-like enzyme
MSFKNPSRLFLMSFLEWNLMVPTGDVKYHLGANYTWPTPSRKKVSLSLVPNPSLNYPQISPPMVHAFFSNFVP